MPWSSYLRTLRQRERIWFNYLRSALERVVTALVNFSYLGWITNFVGTDETYRTDNDPDFLDGFMNIGYIFELLKSNNENNMAIANNNI